MGARKLDFDFIALDLVFVARGLVFVALDFDSVAAGL
jgi:hypothetical protein